VRERELKLAAHRSFVVPDLVDDGLGVLAMQELPELTLSSTYHDTSDLRLARNGVTLRYRTGEEDGPIWTLKLRVPGRDATDRDEHEFVGGPDTVPIEAADLVTAFVRGAPILPVASLSTRRHRWLLCGQGDVPLAELDDDDVTVLDGARVVARFRELEIESRGPDASVLRPIAVRLRRAGAVLAEPVPKAVRALGPRASAEPDVAPVRVSPRDPASVAVRAALAAGVQRVLIHDAPTRREDAEGLHQMRVGVRRLRSDLRTFDALLDTAWATGLREELRWLGDLLGTVRDADVELERLEAVAGDLLPELEPLRECLETRREEGRRALLDGLRGERYLQLLDRLVDAARDPMATPHARGSAQDVLPALLKRPWRRLHARADALGTAGADDEYHQVRIRAKRVRYASEAIGPALDDPDRKRIGAVGVAAAKLQDLLGEMHDASVLRADAESVLSGNDSPRLAYAVGRLVERCDSAMSDRRARYPRAWKQLSRRYRKAT
jgi:CHAD domain-containing protein